ncbi:hypothetical protein SAMN05421819_1315 [Bryocella elongata]|uniref:Coagulation factor 5/8 type domain-containing protein n=1 Tax=Bryocella elongata TaxID=863522 RepID=A0A1H5VUL3_9BACT|nr:hypothetical protein SAMN05421819_1315 [Bryocella elongata]
MSVFGLAFAAQAQTPDLGPNVTIFSPATPRAEMQKKVDETYALERHNEFGAERHAIFFLPGDYHLNLPVGFYTEVAGLGATPDATHLTGDIYAEPASRDNNATTTFWRSIENLAVTPSNDLMEWAVSQAAPMRRLHVMGSLTLHVHQGWASGGWISDTVVDGRVDSGPQQQWISRNTEWKSWTGSNWNMVFVGAMQAPRGDWPNPAFTRVDRTPLELEKPYLVADDAMHWRIVVPSLAKNTIGTSWYHRNTASARSIPFSDVYIASSDHDSAASMNAQLAAGKSLLLTPGNYELTEPLRVMHPNTVVLGLGFATLKPTHGTAAIETADVDGIDIAGLLIDAGLQQSPVLVQVGPRNSNGQHGDHPIALHDVFFRVGGAGAGSADVNLEINSHGTIIDHTWIWRADHGKGVGWTQNLSNTGLLVNGDDVTVYGLFVEHHQRFQVQWNGERGRTYFYQSEIPYDPPTQAAYTSASGVEGWAAYKVADAVKQHEAWGVGVYSVFHNPDVFLTHAFEVPKTPGVRFHDMVTVCLLTNGGLRHIIDDTGEPTKCAPGRIDPKLTEFPTAQ